MSNGNGRSRLAILAVLAIALATVFYFMQDPTPERAAMLLAFLGGITAALLKIAQIERNQHALNGEVQTLRRTVGHVSEQLEPAVRDAAEKMQAAAPVVAEAADRVQEAAPIVSDAADKVQTAAPVISDAAERAEHAAELLPHDEEPPK